MSTTVYVVGFEPSECAWVRSALGRSAHAVINVEDGEALLTHLSSGPDQCVIASADADGAATLALVRALRRQGILLPVIVLGPHSEFRTAVDIARLEATDFLERPVSARELRAALRRIRSDPHSQH
jgi:two-component system response regulator PhoP